MSKIKLIISFLSKKEKRRLVLVLLCMLLVGILEVVGVGSISPFMSVVANPETIETNEYLSLAYEWLDCESSRDFVLILGFAVIGFLFFSNLARTAMSFITRYYSGRRLYTVSLRLMEKYLSQPYVFFLNKNTSDLSKNILHEVSVYVTGVLVILLQLCTNSIIALSIIILLLWLNPLMALAASGVLGFLYIFIFIGARKYINRKGEERAEANSLKYKYASEAFNGIKDVKLLGREKVFLNLFSKPSKIFAMNNAMSEVIGDAPKYILETIAFAGIIGIILVRILMGHNIDDFLPTLTIYAFGGYRLLPALQKIFNSVSKIRYNFPIVDLLYKDYRGLPDGEEISDKPIPSIPFENELVLKNIVFSYPKTQEPVIKKQGLKIKKNTSIGFVGPTGCGKTTMIDIILGLLEPQEGQVLVDERVVTWENRRGWQANLGYVPQSIYLIDDSIKKNIAFGVPEEDVDMKAVMKAAEIANLHDFISSELEMGYDTMVGERGVRLSGGQRQRIGIARAVYHDPSVLIMDEATSALDGLTENAIMDAINNLSHQKTIIMIAHRLTTVKDCDVIFIMERGEIVDQGRYEELMKRNERFRKMAEGN